MHRPLPPLSRRLDRAGLFAKLSVRHRRLSSLLLVGAAGLCVCSTANAATGTYTGAGADNLFSDTANWNNGLVPGSTTTTTNGDTALFNSAGSGNTIVQIDAGRNLLGFTFDTSTTSFTIGGVASGNNTIGSASTANVGNSLLLSSGGSVQLASTVTGNNLTETFNAPIVLGTASATTAGTYTFANYFSSRPLDVLVFAGNISGAATTTANVASTLTLTGTNTGLNTISGAISNGTNTSASVADTLAISKTSTGSWTLSGANTYTGATTVTGGTLTISGSSTGTSGLSVTGGTLIVDATSAGSAGSTNTINSAATLSFGSGGNFVFKAATGGSSQTFASFTVPTNTVASLAFQDAGTSAGGTINLLGGFTTSGRSSTLLNITAGANDVLESTNTSTTTDTGGPTNANYGANGIAPNLILNGTDLVGITAITSGGTTTGYLLSAAAYNNLSGAAPVITNSSTTLNGSSASAVVAPIEISSNSTGNAQVTTAITGINSLAMKDTSARSIAMNGNELILGSQAVASRSGIILSAAGSGAFTIGTSVNDGTITANAPTNRSGSVYLINDSSNAMTINAAIVNNPANTNAGILVEAYGTGTLALAGTNTFSGGILLNGGGTLAVNSASALGVPNTSLNMGFPVQDLGTLVINNGNLDNTSGAAVTNANVNPIQINNSFTFVGSNSLNLGTGAVTLGASSTITTAANTLTLGGAIGTTTNTLTKAGAGTLVLNGNNTYTGATTVNAGTLAINGTNTSAITINNGGTLTGAGSTTGVLTLVSGGNITPGTAGTTNTKLSAASMTFNAGGALTYGLSTTDNTSNNLTLSGAFTKGGTGTYTINLTGGVVGDTYTLANYGSTSFSTTTNAFTAVGDTGTFTTTATSLSFTVSGVAAVPEPGTYAMGLLLVLTTLGSRQGRSWWKRVCQV